MVIILYLCTQKPQNSEIMKQTLNTLKRIEQDTINLGEIIREEGRVARAELEERQRLGLHGDAAIRHYNDWMKRHGMEHLMVED